MRIKNHFFLLASLKARSFLKVFASLFQKAAVSKGGALVALRRARNPPLRPGKSNLIFGSATPKNWGGFSAKKLNSYADNVSVSERTL